MELRHYQEDALEKILAAFEGHRKLLAVAPTGSGKTILFAFLAQAFQPKRTLVLAHREELLTQAIDKIEQATGLKAGLEKAEFSAGLRPPVVVASIQTMAKRKVWWPQDHFGLVVVDEAHHTLAASYLSVLEHFDGFAKVLGVTATPDRGDKKNLGKYYEEIACQIGLPQLINEGFLARIVARVLPVKIDISNVKRTAGDYQLDDLGEALRPQLEDVADVMAREAKDRKTIVFLPLINISRMFARMLSERGLEARAVAGEDADREETIKWFQQAGKGTALCNAMLLTEGYDQPDVDCIVCLRPTQIRSLYAQMIGRGTRIHPGKENLLILDFLWQTDDHKLVSVAHLVCEREDDAAELARLLREGAEEIQKGNEFTTGEEDFDLLTEGSKVEAERLRKVEERLKEVAKRKRPVGTFDVVEMCMVLDEKTLMDFEPILDWHSLPVSDKQTAMLIRAGFDVQGISCRGHASKIIDLLMLRRQHNYATPKQVRMLKRTGHPDPTKATFQEASEWIDREMRKYR